VFPAAVAMLVYVGLLVVLVLLDIAWFRSLWARGGHAHNQLGRTVMTIFGMSWVDDRTGRKPVRCLRLPRLTRQHLVRGATGSPELVLRPQASLGCRTRLRRS
jgi:hypothetical protein